MGLDNSRNVRSLPCFTGESNKVLKDYFAGSILLVILGLHCPSSFAGISEEIHSRCLKAADYLGCINANNQFLQKSVSVSGSESTCWWQMTWGATVLKPAPCYVSTLSSKGNGIIFNLIEKGNGLVRTISLEPGKVSYVTLDGIRYRGTWEIDSESDVWIRVTGGSFAFRLPADIDMNSRPTSATENTQERPPTLYETMSDTPFYWKRD